MELQSNRGHINDNSIAAHRAYEKLQAELRQVQAKLDTCAAQCARLAAAVMIKRAEQLATEVCDLVDTLVDTRRKLASIAGTWI